ncbi:hypothetical protein ACWGH3_04000 [Streptomyces sp. NPDC054884]|uniref:hypothetical protein n=1 Tax=Streptomyces sp. ME08-AFT2 TaxID=3028683 RepID=UPI0029AF9763|nr:hypothetical protein [Streptomyces sp. ME08-AFT2]MDX3308238.1 hypothetical protein [Streptomyces sp. ME08-AFT2]
MYLVTTTVPAGALPGGPALVDRIRRLARPEDRLEHVHMLRVPDGKTRLTLFLGHADSAETERAAARLMARALPSAVGARLDWAPARPLVSALEELGVGAQSDRHDRELPSQDPDNP